MGRIGVLEDDGDFRGQVVNVLESRGHEVRGWRTIADARAGIDLFHPELLLLDVDLPDGCGLDVAHARRADGQKIPSIMLSSHGRETRGLTHADMIMGTPAYLPPEVVIGGEAIDHRSDLYQVGLTLRFAWTGEGAFPGCEGLALLNRIARDPLPPPRREPTPWLEVVLAALLAHDRSARARSASGVLRLLGR